ncbi:unnamed protein product [Rotaria magnacalcarata]|uniref:Pentatricopeptide repeat-containing protein n=2 Tax=Rotaria magnacalcarata TaxID=392030 RepID=A0A8S2SEH6_9BILA|nr:unnamed protein product [Rotaria magnacalcarata]
MHNNYRNNNVVLTSEIHMLMKLGDIQMAECVFKSVKKQGFLHDHDKVTYAAMINGFGLNGMDHEAAELYKTVPMNLRDEITHSCVLNTYSHSGLLDKARIIFNEIPVKTVKIITIMIACLSRLFLFDGAQKLLDEYEKTNMASFVKYMALLYGLRNSRNRILSEKIYNRMKSLFLNQKENLLSGAILLSNIYSSIGEHQLSNDFRFDQKKKN